MQKWIVLVFLCLLTGCSAANFEAIEPTKSFVATVNILQPSIQFFNEDGQLIQEWELEEAYSGAVLVQQDFIVLYGNQLTKAHIYDLSTGELIKEIDTPIGTTNGYYDEGSNRFFLTNSDTNKLYAYNVQGKEIGSVQLRNYPMSMVAHDELLYVVNYKDTILSIVNSETLQVEDEWAIPSSSQGLWFDDTRNHLWIGGHGSGTEANDKVTILDSQTGERVYSLTLPMMPVAIAGNEQQQAVVSHGSNMLYTIENKEIIAQQKISANPFAVAYFNERIVVAGYDDATLYFIKDGQAVKKVETHSGPFQILTREVQ